jgi:excisionase family DNA binding protein
MNLDLQTLKVKLFIKIKKIVMKKQFLDVEGISEYLTMSKSCIYKKVAAKEIPHHKIGARTLFDIDEINMWVKSDGTLSESSKVSFMDIKSFLD